MSEKKLPRGIRNNNPGNIELGAPWQGLSKTQTDGRFAQFDTPTFGIRAIARVLITYQDKRQARDGSPIDTVREIIERWAPASENNVDAYVTAVRRAMFGDPNLPVRYLDVHKYHIMKPLVEAIIRHENGPGPLKNANSWYDDAVIDEGLRLAGIRPDPEEKMHVTRETVTATATGVVGASQIAEVLPDVSSAISASESHLSSGSIVRIVVGVVLIGLAVYTAYGQLQKHKAGAL